MAESHDLDNLSGRPASSGSPAAVIAVAAVVRDDQGRFLLVRRATNPQKGRWTLPGGKVEFEESLPEAVAREVLEETGVRVAVGPMAGVMSVPFAGGSYEVRDFYAQYLGGAVRAGSDADDARWFTAEELPALPLTQDLLDYLTRYNVYP